MSDDRNQFYSAPIRPPWAHDENRFLDLCSACGDCVECCPQSILQPDKDGYPLVNFTNGECTFCRACVDICNDNALTIHPSEPPWRHTAEVSAQCLARRGVACQSCQDACQIQAVNFVAKMGSPALPTIANETCNGCGACVSVCPVDAIGVGYPETTNGMKKLM